MTTTILPPRSTVRPVAIPAAARIPRELVTLEVPVRPSGEVTINILDGATVPAPRAA